MSTTYKGYISLLQKENETVFPITSADGVLLDPSENTVKLSEKLKEIDKSISDIKTVTDNILNYGDGSIEYTKAGLAHAKPTNIPEGLNPTVNEAIYKFKIDKNGHITDIKKASLEDFGVGMPIKYYGEYPTDNSSFTPSAGYMYLVNTEFIRKYHKGDVNDFAIYDGENFNIILSDIHPNIQLNNGTVHIYGTGGETNIYAPTKLGNAGDVLTTNSTKNGLEWKTIPRTNVEFNSEGNKLTIGDKTISFTGGTGISVNSKKTNKTTDITVRSLYSYNEDDFEIDNNTISLKNPQEQVKLSAGDGIDIINNTVSVKLDSDSDSYLTVGKKGLKLNGIESAVSEQISESINKLSGSKKGASEHVNVTVTQKGGNITGVTVAENNIVSTADLANEIKARKAVDGQSGQTYAKNTQATHIKNATSLNDADVLLSKALDTEITNRTTADTNLSNKIASLQGHVESMYASYPYITEEIWGTNHNWDWSKSSRIDNLESTVNNLTFNENKLQELIPRDYEVFGWDLEFGGGLIPMPHENALWITLKTGGYIKLPYPGTYKIKFKGVSPLEIPELTSKITINGVDLDGFYNGTAIYKELITTSNDGKITIGAEYAGSAIFDINITSSRDRDIKLLTKESVSFAADYDSWVSSGKNMINKLLNRGFYIFSFKIKGPSPIGLMCWPIINPSTGEPYINNGNDKTKNRYFLNNAVKYYNINESTYTTINSPYYYIPNSSLVLIQTGASGNYSIKDFTVTKLKFVDNIMGNSIINSSTINTSTINNSIINSSTINNPFLNLRSQNSNLYNRIIEDDGKQYILLVYEVDGVVKWTLDLNGFKMTSVSNPILISEKYYYFSTDPRNINNFNLYDYSPADYKVSGTTIYYSNGNQARDGYYISFINQINLTDRSATHTFITYKSEAIIPIIKTDIIISSTGAIQNSIFIQ